MTQLFWVLGALEDWMEFTSRHLYGGFLPSVTPVSEDQVASDLRGHCHACGAHIYVGKTLMHLKNKSKNMF